MEGMSLKELIAELQDILDKYGDMEVVSLGDESGREYTPSVAIQRSEEDMKTKVFI